MKYAGAAALAVGAGAVGYYAATSQAPGAPTTPVSVTTIASGTATAKPLEVWWATEFFAAEQLAFLETANAYTAKTGVPVRVTFYDFSALTSKLQTACQTGQGIPDIGNDIGTAIGTRLAAQDYLLDISDLVNNLKAGGDYYPTAAQLGYVQNLVAKKQSYYQVATCFQTFISTYWANLLQKYAGVSTPPTDWDGWWGIWEKAQTNAKAAGVDLNAYAWTIFSAGGDSEDAFSQTMFAFGGQPLTSDGKVNWNDPTFQKAVSDTAAFAIDKYQKGFIPAGATAWDDSGNNVSVESGKSIMDYANGSLSIPHWFRLNDPTDYKSNIYMAPFPQTGANGQPWAQSSIACAAYVMKGATSPDVAKDFLAFYLQPENYNNWVFGEDYRYLPVFKSSYSSPVLPAYTDTSDHDIYPAGLPSIVNNIVADYRYVNSTWAQATYGEHLLSNIATSVLTKGTALSDAVNACFARLQTLATQNGE